MGIDLGSVGEQAERRWNGPKEFTSRAKLPGGKSERPLFSRSS
jgi:hypothetical protein